MEFDTNHALLQHTHRHADQIVIPPNDYADFLTAQLSSPLLVVLTACTEPPGGEPDLTSTRSTQS